MEWGVKVRGVSEEGSSYRARVESWWKACEMNLRGFDSEHGRVQDGRFEGEVTELRRGALGRWESRHVIWY